MAKISWHRCPSVRTHTGRSVGPSEVAPRDREPGARWPSARQGSIATQLAIGLPVMLGLTALVVDASYLFNEVTHQQGVMDAAALAGASGFTAGEQAVFDRAIEVVSYNASIAGEPYAIDRDDVHTGFWDGSAFVPCDFASARDAERPAVQVVSPGQATSLFFGSMFNALGTTNVATSAVASRMVVGAGPPANCGIIADASMVIGGSQVTDGYMSDDCLAGSVGYQPSRRDPETGVCSNHDSNVFGGSGNNLWAAVSWGPDSNIEIVGNPVMHGPLMQLAQQVEIPVPEVCTAAEQAASDGFLASPGGCWSGNAAALGYDAGTHDLEIGRGTLTINAGCHAPPVLCVRDLSLGSQAVLLTDGGSYPGRVVKIKAAGDLRMTGQAQLTNVTDTNPATGLSTGNSAGALQLHVQGDVSLRGTTDLSAIITAGGDLSFLGDVDVFGAMYSDGTIRMSGNFDVHIDRCYEISSARGNGNTETVALSKLVLVR